MKELIKQVRLFPLSRAQKFDGKNPQCEFPEMVPLGIFYLSGGVESFRDTHTMLGPNVWNGGIT